MAAGDVDLADCDAEAWRSRLAWVPQSPTLFRGTVADNVRLGSPAADDDAVAEALRLARADRFVALLPAGVETMIGDGGRPLSAGERQRVGLAGPFSGTPTSSSSTSPRRISIRPTPI